MERALALSIARSARQPLPAETPEPLAPSALLPQLRAASKVVTPPVAARLRLPIPAGRL